MGRKNNRFHQLFVILWKYRKNVIRQAFSLPDKVFTFFFLHNLLLKSSTFAVYRFSHLLKSLNEHVYWLVQICIYEFYRLRTTKYEETKWVREREREKIQSTLVTKPLSSLSGRHISLNEKQSPFLFTYIFWLSLYE